RTSWLRRSSSHSFSGRPSMAYSGGGAGAVSRDRQTSESGPMSVSGEVGRIGAGRKDARGSISRPGQGPQLLRPDSATGRVAGLALQRLGLLIPLAENPHASLPGQNPARLPAGAV